MKSRSLHLSAPVMLLACVVSPASATSQFTATVGVTSLVDSSPISHFDQGANANGSFSGTAVAGASVGVKGNAGGPFLGTVFTEASSNIDDVTIHGPGAPGSSVSTTVTLPFTSFLSGEYETTVFGNSGFSGGLQFGTSWNGVGYQANFTASGDSTGDHFSDPLVTTGGVWSIPVVPTFGTAIGVNGTDHSASYVVNGSLVLTQMLPVNVPFTVRFDLIGNCGAGGGNSLIGAVCQFDALDPWGFIPGFASFDLPNGYSVDAPSIGLVNGVVPGPSPVPEPSSLMLFGSGLMLLGAFARMRRSRRLGALRISLRPYVFR